MRYLPYMTLTSRLVTTLIASAVLIAPSLVFAATSVYSDSNGNFQYSSGNFSIGWGTGAGGAFQCGGNNICQVASTIISVINFVLVPLLFALAFFVFLYGIATKYIFSHGDPDKVAEGHKLILWGIVAFAVMVSVWGLVNVVTNTFGLSGYRAQPTPTSY